MKKMFPVVHFEMPANDINRMSEFYSNVFGWNSQQLGAEMRNYVTVSTTQTDETGRPEMAGAINGGFYPKPADGPPLHPSIVIAVDDILDSIKKVKEAGGKVQEEPVEIPGIGLYVSFTDTEDNRVTMLQPIMG